ncbi:hypothetical protein [Thiopseudomonas alkaliphila]|uniref:hypothetical protein n=1 Tax=Thiopseudomonas alkaliphila TaxID=1697053 RepID=UPI00130D92D2|nr:hypothetical protein [Thiopseudomonas alkaliphila]
MSQSLNEQLLAAANLTNELLSTLIEQQAALLSALADEHGIEPEEIVALDLAGRVIDHG